ncbi:MAG TPA: helix-turn-helix transcriptional regulator [Pseudonocardia sp.]|jgi:DNA-binding PadR family transcriptional regulator
MRAEALKGHLDALLLAALEPAPAHGFAVMAELRKQTDGVIDLEGGTLYPALRRLEEAGLIAGIWTTHTGRRRREYHLTEMGEAALRDERSVWQQFVATIGAVLEPKADHRPPLARSTGTES